MAGSRARRGKIKAAEPVSSQGRHGWRPADYLDQEGLRSRSHELGSVELWKALTAHVDSTASITSGGPPNNTGFTVMPRQQARPSR
jgi:hypothetical protein